MSLSTKTKEWLHKNGAASLAGKTMLVTGANSGVGYKTAETAVYLGAKLIMACRSLERANAAREALLKEYPSASIEVMRLDLASLESIDEFVSELVENKTDIDVFVNNAGVFRHPGERTEDGFELVMGTNYMGVYYLSERLIPYLETLPHPVDYVNTTSIIHRIASVDYNDFYYEKHERNFAVYARSKLCLSKYTCALADRCGGGNIRVLMIHPGITITPLGINAFGGVVAKLARTAGAIFNSTEKSALSVAYIESHEVEPGSIIGPSKFFGGWGYPKPNRVPRKDKEGADELIGFTEKELEGKIR